MADVPLDKVGVSSIVMAAATEDIVRLSAEMGGALVQISLVSINQIT